MSLLLLLMMIRVMLFLTQAICCQAFWFYQTNSCSFFRTFKVVSGIRTQQLSGRGSLLPRIILCACRFSTRTFEMFNGGKELLKLLTVVHGLLNCAITLMRKDLNDLSNDFMIEGKEGKEDIKKC